jgi:RNA polymerase sigma-70 factor, ECF subfamily
MKSPNDCPYRRHAASPGSTRSSLLEGLGRSDPRAWDRLTYEYAPWIYRWARREGLHPEDAIGVGQDAFLAIGRGLPAFEHGAEDQSFRGWIRRITRNLAVTFLRKYGKEPAAVGEGPDQEWIGAVHGAGDVESSGGDRHDDLKRAIGAVRAKCRPKTWEAFSLQVMEGRHPTDVAESLGMSVPAVYVAKSKVLGWLRAELASDRMPALPTSDLPK